MYKKLILSTAALFLLSVPAHAQTGTPATGIVKATETITTAPATAIVGQMAPDFKGMDTNGVEHTLSQYKGKIVVLEWTNPECPYVLKHYGSGNMQTLQKEMTAKGVVWLSIASSAKGKEGYFDAAASNKYMTEQKSVPTARILDPTGTIGHLYGAKTTPHMFVVDKDGKLAYAGAIDDNDSFKPETIAGAKNYVREAVAALEAGKTVEPSVTKSYGCSVKYDN